MTKPAPGHRRSMVYLALLALSLSGAGLAAAACRPPELAVARDHSALVFLGFVESVRDTLLPAGKGVRAQPTPAFVAHVRMLSIWKGVPKRELDVLALPSDPAKGPAMAFAAGETYLVFARETRTVATVSACSRSARMAEARGDIDALGQPVIVQRVPARKPAP